MSYRAQFAVVSLLAGSALALADERVDGLIRDLANPDPAVREKASEELISIGEPARAKLSQAAKSPKPAIATAAAAAIAKLPWDRPGDSKEVSQALKFYGDADEDQRVAILLNLLSGIHKVPDAAVAVVRVIGDEPSPRVGWSVALQTHPNETPAWVRAIAAIDLNVAPAPLQLLLARQRLATGSPDAKHWLHEAFAAGRDAISGLDANLMLRAYSLASQNELHADAAWALEQVLENAGGEAFVLNRDNAQDEWPNAEMAARVKWHRFKDAESRKDDATMAKLAKDLLESQSADMGIFLDVYPTLQKTADAEKVEAYFQRAYQRQKARVAEEPGAPVHNNDLAWLLARTGRRLDEAETLAEAAVKAKPEEAAYLDTLAEVKFRLGKIDEAIALEEKALKHMPGDKFMTEQLERFRAAKRPSD